MADFVEIANLVAQAIGTASRVTDPNDDRVLARSIREVWNSQRRASIRDGGWNFAMRTLNLAELSEDAGPMWSNVFKLPAESVRLIEVLSSTSRDNYQLENWRIYCNQTGPLPVRCLFDVTEPGLWDDQFADAFALRMAWRIGTKIAGSAFGKAECWAAYKDALAAAKSTDAMENPPIEQEESDWVLARFGGDLSNDPTQLGGW